MNADVVIPLYNGRDWIVDTLGSVLAQTKPPAEIIVVDDGSRDGSPDLVRKFDRVRLVKNPGKGNVEARQHGFELTRSPLVAFLDHDDLWHPTHLEKMSEILAKHPSACAVQAGHCSFNRVDRVKYPQRGDIHVEPLDLWARFPFGRVVSPSTILTRRESVRRAGGWVARGAGFGYGTGVADGDLWLRMNVDSEFLNTNRVTVAYRHHEKQLSSVLRTQAITNYLESLRLRAAGLAASRIAHRPEDRDFLLRRVAVAESYHELTREFIAGNNRQVRRLVVGLAELLRDEEEGFRRHALNTLCWFLTPPVPSPTTRHLLRCIYANWPARDRQTRAILRERVPEWSLPFTLKHLLRRPWDFDRARLLGRTIGALARRLLRRDRHGRQPPPRRKKARRPGLRTA